MFIHRKINQLWPMILEASTKCSIWIVTRNYTHRYFVDWYFITFQQEIILKLLQLSPFKLHSNPRWFSLWNIWNFGFDLIEYTHKTQWSTCYVTALLMFHSNKCFQTHNRHDSGSKRNQRKSKRSEQHASVASPNGAGGSGGGALWVPPPPAGVLWGGAPYKKNVWPSETPRFA